MRQTEILLRPVLFFVVSAFLLGGCGKAETAETSLNEAQVSKEPYRLIMLGDSITAGYGLPSGEALPVQLEAALGAKGVHIDVINAGVSGDTTGDALARLSWVLGAGGDGVLIALGGNDLLQGVNPARTEENLREIIETAKMRGFDVMLAGMQATGNYGQDFQKQFNALFPTLAKEHDIPFYPFLLEGVALRPLYNQSDLIHPNEKGVDIIVDELAPFIEASVPR